MIDPAGMDGVSCKYGRRTNKAMRSPFVSSKSFQGGYKSHEWIEYSAPTLTLLASSGAAKWLKQSIFEKFICECDWLNDGYYYENQILVNMVITAGDE